MMVNIEDLKVVLEDVKGLEDIFVHSDQLGSYPESLLARNDVLAYLTNDEGYKLYLIATGEVNIIDENDDYRSYKGDQRFENDKLMKAIKSGLIHVEGAGFTIDMNNWLEVHIHDDKDNVIQDYVYENEPSGAIDLMLNLIEVLQETTLEDIEKKDQI